MTKTSRKKQKNNNTYLNFNWKVVGPFNINNVFKNKLILEQKKTPSVRSCEVTNRKLFTTLYELQSITSNSV